MNKKHCIIVDLEGVLTNCEHRMHYLKNKHYVAWNNLFSKDTVNKNMVDIIKRWRKTGKKIILCTAKSVTDSQEIIKWFVKYDLLTLIDSFFFRAEKDKRPSVEVKEEMLMNIFKRFFVIKAYDDRLDICQMYRKWHISTTQVVSKIQKTPDELLKEAAKVFKKKGLEYGSSYKEFGKIMIAYFPNGLELKTEKDFTRFGILNMMIAKTDRYNKNFSKNGHQDSLIDLSVYSAMLQEIDNI